MNPINHRPKWAQDRITHSIRRSTAAWYTSLLALIIAAAALITK